MLKYLVMDVDGTLTDGKIYIGPNGEASKAFHVKDGYGICHILPELEMEPIVITGRISDIITNRCRELGISKVAQNAKNKIEALQKLTGGSFGEVAYIGDDLNDLAVMQTVVAHGGVVGCPKDATKQICEMAHFVSQKNGGDGAVREFIEWLSLMMDK